MDESGKVTDCDQSRDFRRKATEIAICRPLIKYLKFEPARGANGEPVAAKYSSVIDFEMWMKADGYLHPKMR